MKKTAFFVAFILSLGFMFTTYEYAMAKISTEQAKEIALQHAGIQSNQANFIKVEQDTDDGIIEYKIEFLCDNKKFDYTINADSGKIIGHKHKMMHHAMQNQHQNAHHMAMDTQKATDIALHHAQLTHNQVSRLNCHPEMEDGRNIYSVKFWKEYTEYEYEIDAQTGEILEFEIEEK